MGPWYVFIVDEAGYTIAHPRPEIIGRDPSLRVDATGYFYGDDLRAATEDGTWSSYVFLNPATGAEELKHTWAVKRDDPDFRIRLVRATGLPIAHTSAGESRRRQSQRSADSRVGPIQARPSCYAKPMSAS